MKSAEKERTLVVEPVEVLRHFVPGQATRPGANEHDAKLPTLADRMLLDTIPMA